MSDACYLLLAADGKHTYIGCSNNVEKRLRQHNGEICGGAQYTCRPEWRPWVHAAIVSGFTTRKSALSFEWHAKHPRKSTILRDDAKRLHLQYGLEGRKKLFELLTQKPPFCDEPLMIIFL